MKKQNSAVIGAWGLVQVALLAPLFKAFPPWGGGLSLAPAQAPAQTWVGAWAL